MEEKPSKLVPSLIGGSVIGILSTVPIINMGNCLCCMWVILGGALGSYLYWRELPPEMEFSSGDGAVIGFLSGVFGSLFGTLLGYFLMAVANFHPGQEIIRNFLESRNNIPSEFEEMLEEFQDRGTINPFIVFVGIFFSLIINTIFGVIGGMLGASILRKRRKI